MKTVKLSDDLHAALKVALGTSTLDVTDFLKLLIYDYLSLTQVNRMMQAQLAQLAVESEAETIEEEVSEDDGNS